MVIFYCFNVLKKCKRPTISVPERVIIPYSIHLSGLIVQYDSLNITKTHVAAIIPYEKRTDMQNN